MLSGVNRFNRQFILEGEARSGLEKISAGEGLFVRHGEKKKLKIKKLSKMVLELVQEPDHSHPESGAVEL